MKRIIILLSLILFSLFVIPLVKSAPATAQLGVDLTWDGGTTYTSQEKQNWACLSGELVDEIKNYNGLGTDNKWERSWTAEDLNITNFRARITYTRNLGADFSGGIAGIDLISVQITYTLIPELTFVNPTPADASTIGARLRVNVSSNIALTNCKLEHNSSGSFVNNTMTVVGSSCNYDLDGLTDGTFDYRVIGDAGSDENQTVFRTVTVTNTAPTLILNAPDNDTTIFLPNRTTILNVTISEFDPDDVMELFIYASNDSNNVGEDLVYHKTSLTNGTYEYNFTALPIDNNSLDLYGLWHLDNLEKFGENSTHWFDFVNGRHNGSGVAQFPTFNESGKIAGAFQWTNSLQQITIGKNSDFNDSCINGCSICSWANSDTFGTQTMIARYSNLTDERRYFYMGIESDNDTLFNFAPNGGSTANICRATAKGNFTRNVWHYTCGVYNTTDIELYVDGKLQDTDNCEPANYPYNQTYWNLEQATVIGANRGGYDGSSALSFSSAFRGLIDEVAIWNRSISSDEVLSQYRLDVGRYYWYANVTDSSLANVSETRTFNITETLISCSYDCTLSQIITGNVDCQNTALLLTGSGTMTFTGSVTNANRTTSRIDTQCFAGFLGGLDLI